MITTFSQLGIENYLNLIKNTSKNPIAIPLNTEKNQSFSTKINNKARISSLNSAFNIVPVNILMRQEKNESHTYWKGRYKTVFVLK